MNIFQAIALTVLAACAEPIQYARQDYDRYPEYKPEIALHNVARTFDSACGKMTFFGWKKNYEVNPAHIACKQEYCVRASFHYGQYGASGATVCDETATRSFDFRWDELVPPQIVPCENGQQLCVKFSATSKPYDFVARDEEQAKGLVQAMRIQLGLE